MLGCRVISCRGQQNHSKKLVIRLGLPCRVVKALGIQSGLVSTRVILIPAIQPHPVALGGLDSFDGLFEIAGA